MAFGIMAQPSASNLGKQWTDAAALARKTDGKKFPELKRVREQKAEALHRRYLDAFEQQARRKLNGDDGRRF